MVTRWGGLIARILAADPDISAHAIVMIGPPNRGSEVADFMHRLRVGRSVLGPALGDLRTACASSIPRLDRPIGVIAGTRSYLPFTSRLIPGVHDPGVHDGLVSLERTRLDGADWIALDGGHTFLKNHPEVADATAAFLQDGRFPTRDQA